jgi:hypothetical protein
MVAQMLRPAMEYEDELEWEDEGEFETEAFFRSLSSLAQRGQRPAALRAVGSAAARSALGGARAIVRSSPVGSGVRSALGGLALEGEWEAEGEWEDELEWELNPIRRVYPDALMEHLGHAAASAESEAEAEAFIGALIPLAARLAPRIAPTVMRAAPGLIRGVAQVTRTLRRNPATRPLVRTMPTIVRRTIADIDQQSRAGRQVTPMDAVRMLSRQANSVLSNPAAGAQAWRRAQALDRRYHRAAALRRLGGR